MKIQAPCRIGERFTSRRNYNSGRRLLTGMGFFCWESRMSCGVTLYAKRDLMNAQECTAFFDPEEPAEGIRIEFEVPDEVFKPGYPLRELGLDTNATGHVGGLTLTEDSWAWYIFYGNTYGGPMKPMRTPVLDKLFAPILPLRAVQIDLKNFLV